MIHSQSQLLAGRGGAGWCSSPSQSVEGSDITLSGICVAKGNRPPVQGGIFQGGHRNSVKDGSEEARRASDR